MSFIPKAANIPFFILTDLSEIILICWHFLLLSQLKTVVMLNIFVETLMFFYIYDLWLTKSPKEQDLFEIEIQNLMHPRWIKVLSLLTTLFE